MPAWPLPVLLFLLLRPTGYRWLAGGCYCSQSYQVHTCTHGKNDDDTYAHKTKAALSILLPPPNSVTACMLCLLVPSKPGP
jgi:hypothetical protein